MARADRARAPHAAMEPDAGWPGAARLAAGDDQGVELEHRVAVVGDRFGPYLGAVQARGAADALDRAFPFRYASARTGAERDMARIRGVAPTDGPRLRASLVAVLSGDPEACQAVIAELVARRQAAAEALHFERAAVLQRELDGLAGSSSHHGSSMEDPTSTSTGGPMGSCSRSSSGTGASATGSLARRPKPPPRHSCHPHPTDGVGSRSRMPRSPRPCAATLPRPGRPSCRSHRSRSGTARRPRRSPSVR